MSMKAFLRLAGAGALAASCAACSFDAFTYTNDRYGVVRGVNVSLRCRDTYEVLDRADAGTMVVITNAVNEVLAGCLDGGPSREARQAEIARIFLDEKTNRPGCRIVSERPLSEFHREFSYVCPAAPGEVSPRIRRR